MKKSIKLFLALVLSISLVACASSSNAVADFVVFGRIVSEQVSK